MHRPTPDLRISDVLAVLAVARSSSVSIAAKERNVTPSQVSKAIARVQRSIDGQIFLRKGNSIVLSELGHVHLPEFRAIVEAAQRLGGKQSSKRLTLAAPSFVCDAFGGAIAEAVAPTFVRVLELGGRSIKAYANDAMFQLALTPGSVDLPKVWDSIPVATLKFGLFATPAVKRALGKKVTVDAIKAIPFVCPILPANGEMLPGDDGCPIPRSERNIGHETTTIQCALDLAARTDQMAFGPVVAGASWLANGVLELIDVPGWRVEERLFLHSHSELVTSALRKKIAQALAE